MKRRAFPPGFKGAALAPLAQYLFLFHLLQHLTKNLPCIRRDTGEILTSVNAEDAAGAAGNNGGKGFCQG